MNIYKFYVKKLRTKKIVKVIREQRRKEREETKKRSAVDFHTVVDIIAQRLVHK
jgi:hypothetical protein